MWALAGHGTVWHAVIPAAWADSKLLRVCTTQVLERRDARIAEAMPEAPLCATCRHIHHACDPRTCTRCQKPKARQDAARARKERHGR